MPEPITFEPAPEAEAICKELVEDHHQHLVSRKLKCIFRSVARIKGGNTILATIQLLKGKNAFLANMPDPTMLIDIAMDEWAYLDDSQRIALMDHELCHAIVDPESGEVKLRGHDVEEFIEIINRRGFWEPGLERLGRAAKNRIDQYKLFTDEEPTRLDIPSMLENEYEEAGKGAVTTIVVKLDNVIVKAFDLDKPKRSAKKDMTAAPEPIEISEYFAPLGEACAVADRLVERLADVCERVEIVGSIRRRCAEVGDIEVLAIPKMGEGLDETLFGDPVPISLLEHRIQELLDEGYLAKRTTNGYGAWGPRSKRAAVVHWPAPADVETA